MQWKTARACLTRWMVRFGCAMALLLAGCSTPQPPPAFSTPPETVPRPAHRAPPATNTPVLPPAGSGRGGYYQDDGPGEAPPPNLQALPDAEPKVEPYSTRGNKPYSVFGKTYTPITDNRPLKQRGIGSWYGKKFHGQKTSSGERYDMYKMTAAHPTLPIPSYARVTNVKTGAQVIVRVNDRGPFHSSRIIDLSYTAALKLGYIGHGSTELEVERLLPDEIARINSARNAAPALAAAPAALPPPSAVIMPTPVPAADSASASMPMRSLPQTLPISAEPTAPPAAPTGNALSIEDFLKTRDGTPDNGQIAVAATAAMPPSTVPAPASVSSNLAPGAYYLQFGAYAQGANAEALRQRLMAAWPSSLPGLEVQQNGPVYRLYSGPFASRSDAMQAAALCDNPIAKPLIVQR